MEDVLYGDLDDPFFPVDFGGDCEVRVRKRLGSYMHDESTPVCHV